MVPLVCIQMPTWNPDGFCRNLRCLHDPPSQGDPGSGPSLSLHAFLPLNPILSEVILPHQPEESWAWVPPVMHLQESGSGMTVALWKA